MMPDPNLAALQTAFFRALRENAVPDGLLPAKGLDARRRFRIYANQTRVAQADALQAVYPAVCRLVGADFFANMAALFVEDHPLLQADLRQYGGDLPDFIQAFPPLAGLPYLADVARLEWACHESLHARGGIAATSEQPLQLAPHVRLLHAPFQVADVWDFALRDHAPEERLNVTHDAAHLVIARPQEDVEIVGVAAEDWMWLSHFVVPETIAANTDMTARVYWLQRGILSGAA